MQFADLPAAVSAVCPIVSFEGQPSDRKTWAFYFTDAATPDQRAAAQALLDACPEADKPARSATASQLYAVMTDAQTSAWDKAVQAQKLAYQNYWAGGYRDAMPEANPKLGKIAKAAGVDLKALFDLVYATA